MRSVVFFTWSAWYTCKLDSNRYLIDAIGLAEKPCMEESFPSLPFKEYESSSYKCHFLFSICTNLHIHSDQQQKLYIVYSKKGN